MARVERPRRNPGKPDRLVADQQRRRARQQGATVRWPEGRPRRAGIQPVQHRQPGRSVQQRTRDDQRPLELVQPDSHRAAESTGRAGDQIRIGGTRSERLMSGCTRYLLDGDRRGARQRRLTGSSAPVAAGRPRIGPTTRTLRPHRRRLQFYPRRLAPSLRDPQHGPVHESQSLTGLDDGRRRRNDRRLHTSYADDTSPRWSPDGKTWHRCPPRAARRPSWSRVSTMESTHRCEIRIRARIARLPKVSANALPVARWPRLRVSLADPGPEPAGDDPFVITRLAYKVVDRNERHPPVAHSAS